MTASVPNQRDTSGGLAVEIGKWLQLAAVGIVLVCISSRCFLMELPFAGLGDRQVYAERTAAEQRLGPVGPDRSEIARVTFAVLLLGACSLWLVGAALKGRLEVRAGWLAIPIAMFVLWSLASVGEASNKRAAINAWLEQTSLLAAGLLAVQAFAGRRRFVVLVVVLAGIAGALVLKAAWQISAEIPDRIANFELYRDQWLERFGWESGSPQATLIESRIRERAPTGFFGLANLFASMLIMLAGAGVGLAAAKLAAAGRARRARGQSRPPGEVDLGLLAGVLTAAVAAGTLATLILTRSRGAIGAAAAGAAGGAAAYAFRSGLARHWGKCVLVCAVLLAMGISGLLAYGLEHDRLPTKTMTFRWYYWRASSKIVGANCLLGVGPGNFPAAYLRYRRAAAEEEIKMPHNAAVHAACQYGLPGGLLYLTVLGCFLVGAVRPSRRADAPDEKPLVPASNGKLVAGGAVLAAGVALSRLVLAGMAGQQPGLEILFEVILPTGAFAVCLLLAGWWGHRLMPAGTSPGPVLRIAVAAGLVAFVLHNMVTFSLSVPATALVFWTLAGASAAQAPLAVKSYRLVRWPLAAVAGASVVAAGVLIWWPVTVKTVQLERAGRYLREGRFAEATTAAWRAARADGLDPRPLTEQAGLAYLDRTNPVGWYVAYSLAEKASRLDPANYAYHRLAAAYAQEGARTGQTAALSDVDGLGHMLTAVRLNPMDARLRIQYAEMLAEAGKYDEAANQIDAAEIIDLQLFPESVRKLNTDERRRLEAVRRLAEAQPRRSAQAD